MRSVVMVTVAALAGCNQDSGVTKYNSDPEVWITSHASGDTILEGVSDTFRGQVGDPNHAIDELTVTWLIDGVETCPESAPTEAGVVSCDMTFGPGGGEVTLEVRDPEGAGASAQIDLDVQATNPPEVTLTAPVSDGVYYAEQLIGFAGTVSDTEDTVSDLTVTIETPELGDLGFDLEITTAGAVEAFGTLPEGEHAVRLRAVDTMGKDSDDSVVITVKPPNSAPTCAITAPDDMTAGPEGDAVFFEGTVADVDVMSPDWLTVFWSSDKDGALGPSVPDSEGIVGFATGDLSVDTHRITMTVTDDVGATCTAGIYYTVGIPPVLTLTAPGSGTTLRASDPVVFEATVSDNEDPPNEVALRWESDVDGVFSTTGTDSSGAITLTVDSLSAGDQVVTVTATDTDGLYVTETVAFNLNQPPTAPTVNLAPDPAASNQMLVATASGSEDPEGTGTITYRYTWFEDGVESGASVSATYPETATGKHHTYSVSVVANDGLVDGPPGTATVTVVNSAPVLAGPEISAATVGVGETLTCGATATDVDPEDAPTLTYAWSDGRPGTAYTVTPDDPVGGVISCTATADDGDGGVTAASASATVVNVPPVVDAVYIYPGSGLVGDTLTCFAGATDPEGDPTTLTYLWSTGTVGAAHTITASDDPGDTLTCTATATDALGLTDTATATASVDNTPPALDTVTVSPSVGRVGDTLTCSATATDADGGEPIVAYDWSDGLSGPSRTITAASAPGATLTCTAVATDAHGGSDSATGSALVDNTPPVLGTVSISPDPAHNTDTLVCSALATDADAGTPEVTYAWTGGATGADLPLTSIIAASGDTLTCTATAADADGGTDAGTASITLSNRAPAVSIVLSPLEPSATDTLTCTATVATDPDDDATSLAFTWTVDGAPVMASTTAGDASTLVGAFAAGQSVGCDIGITDGKGGSGAASASVLIANTPPVVSSVSLSPDPLTTNDTATATAAVTDADGDALTLTYAFTVGGTVVQDGPSATLDGLVHFDKDDTVAVTVTAADHGGSDTAASDPVTVANALPSAPTVSIAPTAPDLDDPIVCSLLTPSTDDDPDDTIAYTISWTVDGAPFTDTETTTLDGDTVSAESLSAWDEWACLITPNDGTDGGSPGTASLVIEHVCNDGRVIETASGVEFVDICGGSDTIGCTPGISGCDPDETPTMDVTLTRDFYVSRTEITQAQYHSVMGSNPSHFDECGDDCPVDSISWNMAAAFSNALSAAAGLTECYACGGPGPCTVTAPLYACEGYRLLTGAEWEIAARCGTEERFAGDAIAARVAWYAGNSGDRTRSVGTKQRNACGLYDMSGNVAEWVHNWYAEYTTVPVVDPSLSVGATNDDVRATRGGSWAGTTDSLRVSDREPIAHDDVAHINGIRVARSTVVDDCVFGSEVCPALSCKHLLDEAPDTPSSFRWLSPDGLAPVEAFCDMDTDEGGWTRVADNARVFGTGVTGEAYNTEGFAWTEALFAYESGLVHASSTYPDTLPAFNPLAQQFGSENWSFPLNANAAYCDYDFLLTYENSASTVYLNDTDWKIVRGASTDTIQVGSIEGAAACTLDDNYGDAYLDIYVR